MDQITEKIFQICENQKTLQNTKTTYASSSDFKYLITDLISL